MREFNPLEKAIILLLYAKDSEPISSLDHLEAMIFLYAKNNPELEEFLKKGGK